MNTTMNIPRGQVLVLYGIAGDLAKKMIIPALYRLTARGVLDVPVIGVDRGPLDAAALRDHVRDSVAAACGRVDEDVFGALADKLVPVTGDVTEAGPLHRARAAHPRRRVRRPLSGRATRAVRADSRTGWAPRG